MRGLAGWVDPSRRRPAADLGVLADAMVHRQSVVREHPVADVSVGLLVAARDGAGA